MKQLRNHCKSIAMLAIVAVLAACSDANPEAMLSSAKGYLEKADYPAAIIQLKNALQSSPANAEVRFLLARAMLETGDAASAETEARKALDLNYPADQAVPLIARAMLARGEPQKLVSEFGDRKLSNPKAQADLTTTIAFAWRGLGDLPKANAALDEALSARPDHAPALVLKSQLAVQKRDLPGALRLVDAALAAVPNHPEAAVLKAELLLLEGRRPDAVTTLEAAAEANPGDVATRSALIVQLVATKETDKAAARLEQLHKIAPKDLRTAYSTALVSYAKRDLARARDVIQKVLAVKGDSLPALFLSGLINFDLASYAAAEEAMRAVIARVPGDPGATRVLSTIYLRTGRPAAALEVLEPALRRTPNDPALLRAAGEGYLQSSNPAKATQLYERANALDKSDAGRMRLAQMRLGTGDTRGFDDLESLSQADPKNTQPDLALLAAHLLRREFDKAFAAAATVEKKQPGSPLGPYVRGIVYMTKRDVANARANYEKALGMQADFFPALYNLALIDVLEGKPEQARVRYEKLLEKDPKNEQVLLALVQLTAMTGGTPEQVKAAIDRATVAVPNSVRPRLAAINYYVRTGDTKTALVVAQQAQNSFRNDPSILEAAGGAQLAAGETNQAIETYRRLAQLQPQNPAAHMRVAGALFASKDYDGAVAAARRAVAINPDLTPAWSLIATAYVRAGRPQEAIAEARKLQRDNPGRGFGYLVEAELLLQQQQFAQAASVAREGLKHDPSGTLAARLYAALQKSGKENEAIAMADKWLKEHPKDIVLRTYFAQQSQNRKDYRSAAQHYRAVLDAEPENVVVLNNLAWVLSELSDPKARDYAEHAYRQAPFNPSVLDTLGWLLVQQNETARGTQLLRMARNLGGTEPLIRLHYARALLKSGDKAGARRELDELAQLEKAAPLRAEVEKARGEL